jgi:NAD(P)-dependent dehydrogenase (short-subunit alcohol dehydrogenase family)
MSRRARIAPRLPLGRAGAASEAAQAIMWLRSNRASPCVMGAVIDIAGRR